MRCSRRRHHRRSALRLHPEAPATTGQVPCYLNQVVKNKFVKNMFAKNRSARRELAKNELANRLAKHRSRLIDDGAAPL